MKTFKDLVFEPHPVSIALKRAFAHQLDADPYLQEKCNAAQARMDFLNGYTISVICGIQFYSNGRDTYEVGVFHQDHETQFFPSGSIIGWQTQEQVTEIMKEVQELILL